MTATNHALTGALIGLLVGNPVVAVPAALASHFICDALPHFGPTRNEVAWLKSNRFKWLLGLDVSLCALLVLYLRIGHPAHWLLAAVCAFVATSPDFLWFGRFWRANKGKQANHPNGFLRFAANIQWFERPIGAAVEATWLIASLIVLNAIVG